MLAATLFGLALAFGVLQPVLAKYKTRCGICERWIWPDADDEIVEVDGEWCHADCAPEEDE